MSFAELNLSESLVRAIRAKEYETATPIQTAAIPVVLAGRDLFGCAQTGTGKTAAFALPILERLVANNQGQSRRPVRALVLAPTRELASQIAASFHAYGRFTGLRQAVVFGGVSQHPQVKAIQRGADILVATPGRLLDLMNQRLVDLSRVQTLVLDEADQMLDMGFIHDLKRIVARLPRERQTLLFSATMPPEIRRLADQWLRDPLEVRVAPEATPAERIEQSVYFLDHGHKPQFLVEYLQGQSAHRTLVFTKTKHGADKLVKSLLRAGVRAEAIHGNKSQNARQRALAQFKSQHPPVLVATDIASRGLDISGVSHVINFDLPMTAEIYVHRIGRTARAGAEGIAITLCARDERSMLRDIERLTRQRLNIARHNFVIDGQHERALPAHGGASERVDGRPHSPRSSESRPSGQQPHHARRKPAGRAKRFGRRFSAV